MKCPFCGNELEKGKVMVKGRENSFFWASDKYFDEHSFNPSYRFDSSIEKDGGVVVKTNAGLFFELPAGYYCRSCNKLTIDLNGKQ